MNALTLVDEAANRTSETLPLAPGRRLGDFLITRVVGQGGFGIVYEAEDLTLQRRVAIKEYMPSQLASRIDGEKVHPISSRYAKTFELGRKSFIAEARLLAQFRHPGLLEVLHFWEQNGTAYMVMPFYEGRTLEKVLANGRDVVDEAWLKAMIRPVLDALEHMHSEDCYHRDVSADNILIRENGKSLLLDLGAARRVIGDSERALTVMLKPGYAPIEQYADDPACRQGPWTDIYAVAAVLYFAVTNCMPPASASRVMHDSLPALLTLMPRGYGRRFLEAIDRGLSIRPEQRPRTIGEFRSMLFAATPGDELVSANVPQNGLAGETADAAPGARDDNPAKRRTVPIVAAAALSCAFAVSWFVFSAGDEPIRETPAADVVTPSAVASRGPASIERDIESDATTPEPSALVAGASTGPRDAGNPAAHAQASLDRRATSDPAALDKPAAGRQAADTSTDARERPAAKAAAAATTGTLRLSIAPWGEVHVDGVRRGVTPPLKELALSTGPHRIEIRNPAGPSWTKEVVVVEGKPTVVSHRFR